VGELSKTPFAEERRIALTSCFMFLLIRGSCTLGAITTEIATLFQRGFAQGNVSSKLQGRFEESTAIPTMPPGTMVFMVADVHICIATLTKPRGVCGSVHDGEGLSAVAALQAFMQAVRVRFGLVKILYVLQYKYLNGVRKFHKLLENVAPWRRFVHC